MGRTWGTSYRNSSDGLQSLNPHHRYFYATCIWRRPTLYFELLTIRVFLSLREFATSPWRLFLSFPRHSSSSFGTISSDIIHMSVRTWINYKAYIGADNKSPYWSKRHRTRSDSLPDVSFLGKEYSTVLSIQTLDYQIIVKLNQHFLLWSSTYDVSDM